ncbi:MAG: hypothetical protein AB8I69_08895 [Anaerolineae bacterium]
MVGSGMGFNRTNLKELQTNASKLIEDLQKGGTTEDITRKIEEELGALEQTRIEAIRVAEKIQRHQKALQEHQAELASLLKSYSEAQKLRLQDAMDKQHRLFQMISNIMKAYRDTQKTIIENLK